MESSEAKANVIPSTSAEPAGKADPLEKISLIVKLLRPKQWTKNLIAFAPALFSMKIHEPDVFTATVLCFVAFCMASSSIYVFNDVLDCKSDRLHPTKRNRPVASGKVKIALALSIGFLGALGSIALGFAVRPTLAAIIVGYLALMILYGAVLKHYVLLDVFSIAGGFVLRAVGGAAAAAVASSGWFLACTSFGALFLGLEKRRQEIKLLKDDAGSHRKSLTMYSAELLDRMEAIIIPSLLTCYAFYSFQSYHGQWMMLTLPFVLYGVMRYQVLSVNADTTGTPEEVLLRDRPIQLSILLWILTCAGVVYGVIPQSMSELAKWFDSFSIR